MTTSSARGWAAGGAALAASLMIMLGFWQFFIAVAAIAKDEIFVNAPKYTFAIDVTAWGWIHLLLALTVIAAGVGVIVGATWARVVGITVAVLVAINNFLFLPYYPLWSMVVIGLAVFTMWAMANWDPNAIDADAAAP
ncbi:DUF7144 family membrane protein [Pilimelia columellifera]|uniref:DUF7144 domain-containing protein n=1 Tax=Pilimelia columellifera subsp. columellifera TaxID=706583 RepID=A0ABP6AYQ2_9ACTN